MAVTVCGFRNKLYVPSRPAEAICMKTVKLRITQGVPHFARHRYLQRARGDFNEIGWR